MLPGPLFDIVMSFGRDARAAVLVVRGLVSRVWGPCFVSRIFGSGFPGSGFVPGVGGIGSAKQTDRLFSFAGMDGWCDALSKARSPLMDLGLGPGRRETVGLGIPGSGEAST